MFIAFYTGYSTQKFNGLNYQYTNVGGTEIATILLAEQLAKLGHNVFIFCASSNGNPIKINGVTYIDISKMEGVMNNTRFDAFVICRFLHTIVNYNINSKKIYLWVHDPCVNYYNNGQQIYNFGIPLLNNVNSIFDNIIILSEWHKKNCMNLYKKVPETKYKLIGNGIDIDNYNYVSSLNVERQKLKFTYCSDPSRGLDVLLDIFDIIHKKYNYATLDICWSDLPENITKRIESNNNIKFLGRLDQKGLTIQLQKTHLWLYPLTLHETFCISALQAQLAGCICIYPNNSALTTTIGDRGICIHGDPKTKEWKDSCVLHIDALLNEPSNLSWISSEWAKTQTWENKAKEWESMFEL
jgi:glycosyltransferase involved in cell wall biosynthesis